MEIPNYDSDIKKLKNLNKFFHLCQKILLEC